MTEAQYRAQRDGRRHEFAYTGNCTVRERTGDGAPIGQCHHSTYEGVCPRHGNVSQWLGSRVDENDLLPRAERDFGSAELRAFLGVDR